MHTCLEIAQHSGKRREAIELRSTQSGVKRAKGRRGEELGAFACESEAAVIVDPAVDRALIDLKHIGEGFVRLIGQCPAHELEAILWVVGEPAHELVRFLGAVPSKLL